MLPSARCWTSSWSTGGRAASSPATSCSGLVEPHFGDAVVLATGGYANAYFLSTNAKASNATAIWRAYRRGAAFANPGFAQFHPTCLPAAGPSQAKLTLMSESLRNDARVWVPSRPGDDRRPDAIPEAERDYFLERRYPRYGNLVPRDLASRAVKAVCDEGRGVGPGAGGVYLDLGGAAARLGAGAPGSPSQMNAVLSPRISRCRSRQLYEIFILPPTNHFAKGSFHSSTVSHFLNQSSVQPALPRTQEYRPQRPHKDVHILQNS